MIHTRTDTQGLHAEPVAAGEEWYSDWFASQHYLSLYSHRDRAEAEQCVHTILRATGLNPAAHAGLTALDVCCGAGRHAVMMAEAGMEVTAIDLSPTLLDEARQEALRRGVQVEFLRQDMRALRFTHQFDLAVQMFTSLGYFDSARDDMKVLHGVSQAVKSGGFYVLDLMNPEHLHRSIVPRSIRHLHGLDIVEERAIVQNRVVKAITLNDTAGTHLYTESVRLYSRREIADMLDSAGLEPVMWFGDYFGSPYEHATSARMLIVCRNRKNMGGL